MNATAYCSINYSDLINCKKYCSIDFFSFYYSKRYSVYE